MLKPLYPRTDGRASVDQELKYNWTVSSGERAESELGLQTGTLDGRALAEFLKRNLASRPELLKSAYDDWGLDVDYIRAWGWWFAFPAKGLLENR